MKVELDIDLEKFRLSLVGDDYLYEEVKDMPQEKLIEILQKRLNYKINKSYRKTLEWGLLQRGENK